MNPTLRATLFLNGPATMSVTIAYDPNNPLESQLATQTFDTIVGSFNSAKATLTLVPDICTRIIDAYQRGASWADLAEVLAGDPRFAGLSPNTRSRFVQMLLHAHRVPLLHHPKALKDGSLEQMTRQHNRRFHGGQAAAA